MKKKLLFWFCCSAIFLSTCASSASDAQNQTAGSSDANVYGTYAAADVSVTEAAMETDRATAAPEPASAYESSLSGTDRIAGMNYFSFHEKSTTYTDAQDRALLKESLTEPVFSSADPALREWVSGVIEEIQTSNRKFSQDLLSYAKRDLETVGEENFYCYSNYVSMEIGRHDDTVASLLTLSSSYSGGENPSLIQTAYNLDLRNLRVLTLEDIIYETKVPVLTQKVQSALDAKFSALGDEGLFAYQAQAATTALKYGNMTPYWYFDDAGLVIFFNQYEISPNATGIIKVQLSYEELGGILLPEFIPEAYRGTVADVHLTSQPAEGEWIYYIDFSPGKTVYISIDGTAHHVQLSEVYNVEQTTVAESILFSANCLDDMTTIAVTDDLTDRSYIVTYYDEQGGPYVEHVNGAEILDELS